MLNSLAAQLLAVVDSLHEALMDDIPVTKRCAIYASVQILVADIAHCSDIYYRNPTLFKRQSTVDRVCLN